MLSKVRTALHQAVEEVAKEFDSSYEQTKRYNESLRGTNRLLMKRIKELKGRCAALQEELDKARPENCAIFKVHLSDEAEKIAELNKELADLRKETRELCEQLKDKTILGTVIAQKYRAQQNALTSCERGEACEVELDDGAPFEKGYFLRLTKKEYELMKDDRLSARVAFREAL